MKKLILLVVTVLSLGLVVSCKSAPEDLSNMVANIDPFDLGTCPLSVNGLLLGNLETKDSVLNFAPRANVVVVNFPAQGAKYALSLKPETRTAIADAITRYYADFDQRTLQKKGRERKSIYGTAPSALTWGVASFIPSSAKSLPVLQLGYTFIDDSPYFTITMPASKNIKLTSDSDYTAKESMEIILYFTRAQAERFSSLMAKENLDKEIAARNVPAALLPEGQKELNTADTY